MENRIQGRDQYYLFQEEKTFVPFESVFLNEPRSLKKTSDILLWYETG